MSLSSFLGKFRRVTSSSQYLPEIDGIRFIAVFSVVVVMHCSNFINQKFYDSRWLTDDRAKTFVLNGGMGVSLFLMVSGFILSLPFARWRLQGQSPVLLKTYYLRRLTRLEPPYLIVLLLSFAAHVWLLKTYTFAFLWPHLLASALYLHTLVYDAFPLMLPVAWTLEVEVQFYLLAPLFCTLFLLRQRVLRWAILLAVIAVSAVYWFDVWQMGHVFMYLHFFFSGILLADLYCSKVVLIKNERWLLFVGLASLAGFFFLDGLARLELLLLKLVCMFLFFHAALHCRSIRGVLSKRFFTAVGSMSYSIYLLHFAVISAVGMVLLRMGWLLPDRRLAPVYYLILIAAVLIASGTYFLWVEKPFMKPRLWQKKKEVTNPLLTNNTR